MKKLTVQDIMCLRPCPAYPESRVRELWGDRESLSLIEILRLDIPADDRIWVLTRDGVCDRAVLRRWADAIAGRAVRNHALTCGILVVESWARCWLDGTDRTYAAAYAAADAAYAARAAARAARAARAAVDAADAAWVAADASAAERDRQVQALIALLEETHD